LKFGVPHPRGFRKDAILMIDLFVIPPQQVARFALRGFGANSLGRTA